MWHASYDEKGVAPIDLSIECLKLALWWHVIMSPKSRVSRSQCSESA
jgi:hypothetical protein